VPAGGNPPAGIRKFRKGGAASDAGNELTTTTLTGAAFPDAAPAVSDDVYTWRAICCAICRRRGRGANAPARAKHFNSYRGPAMKPWLFAILRNVCRADTLAARRRRPPASERCSRGAEQAPLWHETPETPKRRSCGARCVHDPRLVEALPTFQETFVLREIIICRIARSRRVGAPVGTG